MLVCALCVVQVCAEDTVKLGVIVPLTGAQKKFGDLIKNGCTLAQDEINAGGGFLSGPLKGKKLELVFEDTASNADTAAAIAEKLVNEDKYPLLLGGYSSSEGLKIAEVSQKYQIPYLCSVPSADKITAQGFKNVFRSNPSASQYITGLSDFLNAVVKPATMAILYEETDYGKGLSAVMKRYCEKQGIKVVYEKAYVAKSPDYKPLLLEMKLTKPDVVFMVSYLMDAIVLVKQSAELGIKPGLFAGGAAGFALQEFVRDAGAAAENLVTADLWAPDLKYPGISEFLVSYRAKYGEPTYHAVASYVMVQILVNALSSTESLSSANIAASLKNIKMKTVFGPVQFEDFDGFTNQNRVPTLARQVQKGALITIWPKDVAADAYVYPVTQ
jgi:branched-chain amino acid transport system substrate-binding protein